MRTPPKPPILAFPAHISGLTVTKATLCCPRTSQQLCLCSACTALNADATKDQNFIDIATASNLGTTALNAIIAPVTIPSSLRRSLLQTTDLTQVSD